MDAKNIQECLKLACFPFVKEYSLCMKGKLHFMYLKDIKSCQAKHIHQVDTADKLSFSIATVSITYYSYITCQYI